MKTNDINVGYGFKLFERDNRNGNLYPLFIDAKEVVPMGEWLEAKYVPTKGFAPRGGWHIGEMPDAPWLKGYDGSEIGCYKSKRGKSFSRVWCVVMFNANHNYDEETKQLAKKCFTDRCPEDGFYNFTEVGKGNWIISSDMKVIRIISETERKEILNRIGYDETETYAKYKESFEKRNHSKMIEAIRAI